MNKILKITNCNNKPQFIKAIMDNTNKSAYESKCIADSLVVNCKSIGTLLLNESSITPEQWETIVEQCNSKNAGLEWHYVE